MLTPALLCPELIGRRAELDALAERRRAAAAGHGALVLISGDAGIGKTRLLRSFRESLTGGRAAVGAGGYDEFANVPYGAIVEALRGLGSRKPLAFERTRAEQLAALADRLAATCARRNVVLLLEDLHWADEASFAFLLHLMRSLATLRLLVVATYRSDELHRAHLATPFIARLARDPLTSRIALEPLSAPDMQRFVRSTLDGRPRPARRDVDDIIGRSEGNPFFAEELLKNALERVDAATARGALPLTIRAAVSERLKLLDAQAHAVLSLAAVVGRRFDASFIATIAGVPLGTVFDVLRLARDLQLIDELPTHPVSYAFRHALTRDAIYAEMLVGEVRPLHLRIVAALEREGAERSIADLGYHAWAARDADKAVRYNERAGDDAEALHAYADALRSYERALEFAHDDGVVGRLLEKSARSTAHDGNAMRAARLAQAAIETYRRAGLDDRVAELYYFVAGELHAAGESDRAMEFLRDGLDNGTAAMARIDRARLALPLAYMLLDRGAPAQAQVLIDECSTAAGDADFAHMYWNTKMYAAAIRGDAGAARQAREAYAAATASGDLERRVRAHANIGINLFLLGEDRSAKGSFDTIARLARESRLSVLEVLVGGYEARYHARGGRLAEARAVVERLLRLAEPPTTIARVSLAAAALTVGRILCDDDVMVRAGGSDVLEAAFRSHIGSTIGAIAGPYARRLHDRGEHTEAVEVVRRALSAIATPFGATDTLLAAMEIGDAQMRRDAVARADTMESSIPLYAATSAHMRAIASLREEEQQRGRDFANAARAHYVTLGWHYHAAVCTELAGERDAAAQAFRSMGALFDARRLELGAVPRGTQRGGSGLSRREWEIAELIAGGTPNRAVAECLALSEKTVEKHLTAIYQKLGFRNRSQLAAFVIRKES